MPAPSDRRLAPVHRVTLWFTGRTQAEINAIVTMLQSRAQEHGGFVGIVVDDPEVERPCSS